MTRIAISGFGRIGRLVARAVYEMEHKDLELVLINTPGPTDTSMHLYNYDSVHGRAPYPMVKHADDVVSIGKSGLIQMTHERDPANIPYKDYGVDIVLECSGRFNSRIASMAHIEAGAKRVLVSAPCNNADITVVHGVNHLDVSSEHQIISNASCTTNCLAPVAAVLDDAFGIENGYATTIHAVTGGQPTLDSSNKDLRRARAAGMSMIPTTTGAAKAVGLVLPQLDGKLLGSAIRVPTNNVSCVDLTVTLSRPTTAETINHVFREASGSVLGFNYEPLVSIDYNGDSRSSIVDGLSTTVLPGGSVARVLAWYDNEWGFSCRMLDNANVIGRTL